jgi:GNAT superfamily N-acetyltransferase
MDASRLARALWGGGYAPENDAIAYGRNVDRQAARSELLDALAGTWPAQMAKSAVGAAALPGDVYAGRVDPTSQQGIERAADLAGFITGGSFAAPRPAGSLGMGGMPEKAGTIDDVIEAVTTKYPGLKLDISSREGKPLVLSRIVVPEESRGRGVGSDVMQQILKYADDAGSTVALSPSSDFGGNKKKLQKWYQSLGFISNKGTAADYEISESMYRLPITPRGK